MSKCNFGHLPEYDELGFPIGRELLGEPKFECPYEALPGNTKCIFHDLDYYKKYPEDFMLNFYTELEKVPTTNQAYFVGLHFPYKFKVAEKIFTVPFNFSVTEGEEALFWKIKFSLAEFFETKIEKLVFMITSFNNAKFLVSRTNSLYFGGCDVKNGNFFGAKSNTFSGFNSQFYDSTFRAAGFQECNFWESKLRDVDFTFTKFEDKLSFRNCYLNNISFRETEFNEHTEFYEVVFPSKTELVFEWDQVPGEDEYFLLKFLRVKLELEWVITELVEVERIAQDLIIVRSTTDEKHSLSIANYHDYAVINNDDKYCFKLEVIKRNKEVIAFIDHHFDAIDFTKIEHIPILFQYCKFNKSVHFKGVPEKPINLSFVSFKGTDLTNVEFDNVEWLIKKELFLSRSVVIDELMLKKYKNYQEVSKIYNQLRKNFESKLAFNQASNFFIGEMECIRKSLWKSSLKGKARSIVYWMYKWLGMYGETISLPLIWIIVIISFFSILRYSLSYYYPIYGGDKIFFDSVATFFQITPSYEKMDMLHVAERIASPPILATLFIALRRKFERKS